MKNFAILFLLILLSANTCFATRYITTTSPAPNVYNYNPNIYNNNNNMYGFNNSRLSEVELSLYGRTYESQTPEVRLSRLEKSVFNKTFPAVPFDERINNLIMNYNNNYNNYNNNFSRISNKTGKINNLINGLNSIFYGTPTGMTPPVQPYYGYGSNPDWGRQSSYYGNKGWRVNNEQLGSGFGIKILD